LYVKLDKYQAAPNEVVKGKIFGVDKFGNLKTDLKDLKVVSSDEIKVSVN
jgi:S-adenosylmethionine hydrolase